MAQFWRVLAIWVFAFGGIGAGAAPPAAQTQNTSAAAELVIDCEPALNGAASKLRAAYPQLLADIERKLGLTYRRPLQLYLVRDHDEFRETVKRFGGGEIADDVAAVAFSFIDVIVLKSEAWRLLQVSSMEVVLQHEVTHCVLGLFVRENPHVTLPLWLNEGIAQWVSESPYRPIVGPLDRTEFADLAELEAAFGGSAAQRAAAYSASHSLVGFISAWGARDEIRRGNIRILLRELARGRSPEAALAEIGNMPLDRFIALWRGDRAQERGLPWPQIGGLLFGGFIGIASLLAWSTRIARRRRAMAKLEQSEAALGENVPDE